MCGAVPMSSRWGIDTDTIEAKAARHGYILYSSPPVYCESLMLHGLRGGLKDSGELLGIPILLLGPPIALWLAGVAAGWAFRGFSAESEASDH